jgi:hypothetical protein
VRNLFSKTLSLTITTLVHRKYSSHLNLKLMNNNIDHMELSEAKLKNIADKTVAF